MLPQLLNCLATATRIDFLVAFLMQSGVDLLVDGLREAVDRGVPVRIVCGDYMGVTQPSALYRLRSLLGDRLSLRFYREPVKAFDGETRVTRSPRSFHPKAWFFHWADRTELFLGSSNASRSALLDGVEWNVRLDSRMQPEETSILQAEFEDLYHRCSVEIDDVMLRRYSLHYRVPKQHASFDPPMEPSIGLTSRLPIDPDFGEDAFPLEGDVGRSPETVRVSGDEDKSGVLATGREGDPYSKADDSQLPDSFTTKSPDIHGLPAICAIPASSDGITSSLGKSLPFPTLQPNDPQTEALYALHRTRELGNSKALVVAATGVGKTFLAAFDSHPFPRVLYLAHREELLTQAETAFRKVRPSDPTGFYMGDRKDTDAALLFASVQTLGKAETLTDADFPPDRFDYVVVDEFHHAAADSYRRVLDHFRPRFLLGLTATPERMDNREVFSLCDYNVVYDVRLREAIGKGWLAPFHYYGVADNTVRYENILFQHGRYDGEQLEKALSIPHRADLVLQNYRRFPSRRAIGFCAGRNHAANMAHAFQRHGIAACAVMADKSGIDHADTVMDRTEALNKLRDGSLAVVFAVDMLNEGVDVPAVDLLLFLRPTESGTVFLQQLGRGLRKTPDKTHVTVLDFIGNHRNVGMVPRLLTGDGAEGRTDRKNHIRKAEDPEGRSARGTIIMPEPDDYPDSCRVQFDWDLIDLFRSLERRHAGYPVRALAGLEYDRIADYLGHGPSLTEYDEWLDDAVWARIKGRPAPENPMKDWLAFRVAHGIALAGEKALVGTVAHAFLTMLQNTAMAKTYKMPLLLAFHRNGQLHPDAPSEAIVESFRRFYASGVHGEDMLKDAGSSAFRSWSGSDWLSLAMRNPVHFLLKTESRFFYMDGPTFRLADVLELWLNNPDFMRLFLDITSMRTKAYCRERLQKRERAWYGVDGDSRSGDDTGGFRSSDTALQW